MKLKDFDIYDIFAEIAFGLAPKSRKERVEALHYKHDEWFKNLPEKTVKTLFALAKQFEIGGIEELENPHIFNVRDVVNADGLQSLKILGEPKDIIIQTKERIFAL